MASPVTRIFGFREGSYEEAQAAYVHVWGADFFTTPDEQLKATDLSFPFAFPHSRPRVGWRAF